ncbi:MAG: MFS transporter [Paraprevotella sp.]|nr:MFS transporter [Paraprevotella sp.]
MFFRESLEPERRKAGNVWSTFRHYGPILHHHRFMHYVWIQALAMGVMFTYISASPFIFQEHFGVSPLFYSLCFGVKALGIMLGALSASRFKNAVSALRAGVSGFTGMSLCVALVLVLSPSVWPVEVVLFIFLLFLGLILPSSTTLALDLERENSGNASALLGFLTFLAGGVLSPLAGMGNMLYTTGLIMVACCIGIWFCLYKVKRTLRLEPVRK